MATLKLETNCFMQVEDFRDDREYALVFASVGDCKAFHWSYQSGRVTDITFGNRLNVRDARDPGGRLGPYVGQGEPDLRNLKCYFHPCHEGTSLSYLFISSYFAICPSFYRKVSLKCFNWSPP